MGLCVMHDQLMADAKRQRGECVLLCMRKHSIVPILAVTLVISACSPRSGADDSSTDTPTGASALESDVPTAAVTHAPTAAGTVEGTAGAETAEGGRSNDNVLSLEGLGTLRVGRTVPTGSTWAERGAQTSDGCRTVTSPDYPGVYGMVINGKVRRITVGQRSNVKLVEGIGIGSTEKAVNAAFGGFRAEPHKYESYPAKYLTAPNAASGDVALRFEIGRDGKVSQMHVGMMPELAYVEGCA